MKLNNKTILVTGGTGSFGQAFVERILKDYKPKKIIVFSRDENKQHYMRERFINSKLFFEIGDVRDRTRVFQAMQGVDYVFHAAALKQVPSCEFFPLEAAKTNIMGANNVLEAAIHHKVKKVIMLSTDKAVYPTSVMGMSKAMMEKIALNHAKAQSKTEICITRYGNIMMSRGSVIPLFIKQVKDGKPITITDPDMTRFLMTINDAIDLVVYAFEKGKHGDLFVKKAKACTIRDLALCVRNIYKMLVPITIIGHRHGEKLTEDLLSSDEVHRSIDRGDFFIVKPDNRSMTYGKGVVNRCESYNSSSALMPLCELEEMLKVII